MRRMGGSHEGGEAESALPGGPAESGKTKWSCRTSMFGFSKVFRGHVNVPARADTVN